MGKQQQEENRQEGWERLTRGWILKVNWLRKIPWITGTIIYSWIIFATLTGYSYQEFNWEKFPNFASWIIFIGVLLFLTTVIFIFPLNKENSENKKNNFLEKTLWGILPAFYLLVAIAILTLTLMTYQFEWRAARQGIATIFASMFAAVGVMVSVAVSYKTGEENRLAQQENLEKQLQSQQENLKTQLESQQKNLETQLEHQRTLEAEKGAREQQKLDAELIKNLNDRLHEIIPRRYGNKPTEVSASYFQLAALYRDWETLATTSDLIGGQKKSQQKNILKLLFGVYQEQTQTKNMVGAYSSAPQELAREVEQDFGNKSISRSQVDIRTLNSVIQDIFSGYQESKEELPAAQDENLKGNASKGTQPSYDLSYLDLRDLDLSQQDLRRAILKGARLEGANLVDARLEGVSLWCARLEGANLWHVHLVRANLQDAGLKGAYLRDARLEGANLVGAHLEGAYLWRARLEGANLWRARLVRANLRDAGLKGAYLGEARLEGADLRGAHLRNTSFFGSRESSQDTSARERIINQLKEAKYLPNRDELIKAKDFDQALVDDIIKAHEEHHNEDQQ